MCSEKHHRDTWFIVAEEDFRLYEDHDVDFTSVSIRSPGATLNIGSLNRAARLEGLGAVTESLSPLAASQRSTSMLGCSWAPADIEFLLRTTKTLTRRAEPSEDVKDLIRLANEAHRRGRGDLLWYSWEPGKRKQHPGHGSTLVGLSWTGAHKLRQAARSFDVDHFDLSMLAHLNSGAEPKLDSAYVFPSIGHFATHVSGCESKDWTRENAWKTAKHNQSGTRAGKDMWFGSFQKANITWLEPKIDLDRIGDWLTCWNWETTEVFRSMHQDMREERSKRQMRLVDTHNRFRTWVNEEAEV